MKLWQFTNGINYAYLITFVGNLLALTGDTTLTWTSPVLPKLNSSDPEINPLGAPISQTEESWIGSLQFVGAIVGMLPLTFLAGRIGRKPVILFLAVPHIISFFTFSFAKSIGWYYLGRFLGGLSLSSSYIIVPIYIAEISEDPYRGMLLVSFSTFASFGDLIPYVIGPYVSMLCFNLILSIFPIVFFVLFLYLAPESPYHYVDRNDQKAEESLKTLRRGKFSYNPRNEIDETKKEKAKNKTGDMWNSVRKKYVWKGFIVILGLSSFQQLSGLGAIMAYTEYIFTAAGTTLSPDVCAIIVGAVFFLAGFGGPLIVDRRGRRFLLIISALGCMVSEAVLGLYFYFLDKSNMLLDHLTWIPLLCLMAYTISFCLGFGPLPHTLISEILPLNVKFILAPCAVLVGWIISFLVTRFFGDLNILLGRGGTFWLFSGCCALALVFIIFFVPETKGKSFQEIQKLLNQ